MSAGMRGLARGESESQRGAALAAPEPLDRRGWNSINLQFFRRPPDIFVAAVLVLAFLLGLLILLGVLALFFDAVLFLTTANPATDAALMELKSKHLLVAVPAIGAILSLPFVLWRLATLHRQANIARESHLTSLMSKALDHLSATRQRKFEKTIEETVRSDETKMSASNATTSTKRTTRETSENTYEYLEDQQRGAVYFLTRIATDSARDAWPIAGTLAAYVRRINSEVDEMPANTTSSDDVHADRRARIRRLARSSFGHLVEVIEEAGLQGREPIDLNQFQFGGERLVRANLNRLDLSTTNFYQTTFDACTIRHCILSGAVLRKSKLTPGPRPTSDNPWHDWHDINADGADFSEATLDGLCWSEIRASEAKFDQTTMRALEVRGCDFIRSSFQAADLSNAILIECNLAGADLDAALLDACDLSGASGLTHAQLETTYGDAQTKLPEGIVPPAGWLGVDATREDRLARDQRRIDYIATLLAPLNPVAEQVGPESV